MQTFTAKQLLIANSLVSR